MSRSNLDKPFYVDVGTSIVAVRCASNHDVVLEYDHSWRPSSIELARTACDRMNREAEIGRPRRNCDRFATVDEAHKAHEEYSSRYIMRASNKFDFPMKFEAWLFAPTTEGGNNGNE